MSPGTLFWESNAESVALLDVNVPLSAKSQSLDLQRPHSPKLLSDKDPFTATVCVPFYHLENGLFLRLPSGMHTVTMRLPAYDSVAWSHAQPAPS